jgi:thiol-disulfide isomerase/thioredoxin
MRTTLLSLAVAVGLASVAAAQSSSPNQAPPQFPDFEFYGAEGGTVSLSELKGNVVLINVWATWCGPCRKELPLVQKMYDTYSDRNFVVLSVSIDADRNRIEPFLKQFNISLPIYFPAAEDMVLASRGIPQTFLIGPDRTLLDEMNGYHPSWEERWKKVVEKYSKPRK